MGPGESHAGITVPEGDPEALRELARTFGATAKGLGEAAQAFGGLPGELSDWRGPASVAFAATAAESSSAAQAAMVAFARKERAAEAAGEELQAAQEDAREAIEQAKDAERRIDAARTDMEAARAEGDAALERAAAADVASKVSDLFGPMAMQALADRQAAQEQADAAGEREREAKRRLHRAEGDLDQAQRRATRIDQRAEELSDDLSRTLAAAAPANVLASLGGPAVGVGGALAPSPLARLAGDQVTLAAARGGDEGLGLGPGGAFGDLGDLPTLLPPHILALLENIRRDRLDDIERDYQVKAEEEVDWEPGPPLGWATKPKEMTRTEAELVDKLSAPELMMLTNIQKAADQAPEHLPNSGTNGGHKDAYRHTYASALMVSAFGEEFTRQLTTAHEAKPANPSQQEAMDLHNNEVGRRIAAENPDANAAELAERVERAIEDGEVIVIDGDKRLAFSDRVPPGGTGDAIKEPPRPGGRPLERPDGGYDPGYGVTG